MPSPPAVPNRGTQPISSPVKTNLLLQSAVISEKSTLSPKSNSSFLERTNDTPPIPPNRAVAYDKEARKFSAMKNGKKSVPVLMLRIQRGKAESRQVGFYLVNAKTRKLAKQCDANRFGFLVEPEDALDVLKLVSAQVEADNAKLTIEQFRDSLEVGAKSALLGRGQI